MPDAVLDLPPTMDAPSGALLSVRGLRTRFATPEGHVHAVNGVDLDVRPGETLAIVGESGSGKSVSMLSVMGLLPSPPAEVSGSVTFEGRELLGMGSGELRRLRGNRMAMIFQDPMSSLNPVHPVGAQIGEALRIHRGATAREAARGGGGAARPGRHPGRRGGVSTTTRTSSPAACASA